MYYSLHDILTYNRLYNLITGVRGHGKTYALTKRCIDVGLEEKKISFVVLARYKEDIELMMELTIWYFTNISHII